MAGDGRGLSLVGFPDDLLALIIENLSWEDRWEAYSLPMSAARAWRLHKWSTMHVVALD